ncbi:hypothetical protein [Chitiniphilus shinanonensis]|uniref:hypothetical protein n=1 Tax=Chitiniphilus shinanonensis TaxID=553088 RepID=UPI0030511EDF
MADPHNAAVTALANFNDPAGGSTFAELTGRTLTVAAGIQASASRSLYGTTSAALPGAGAIAYLGAQATAALDVGVGPFTIEWSAWMNTLPTGYPGVFALLHACPDDSAAQVLSLLVFPGGGVQLTAGEPGTDYVQYSPGLSAGMWYRFALQRDAGALTLFINGVPQSPTLAFLDEVRDWQRLQLGSGAGFGGPPGSLDGYLNGFRVTAAKRYSGAYTPVDEPFTYDPPEPPAARTHQLALTTAGPAVRLQPAPALVLPLAMPRPALRFSQWTLTLSATAPRIGAPWLALPAAVPALQVAMTSDRSHALTLSAPLPAAGVVLIAGRSIAAQLGAAAPGLSLTLAKGITHAIALPVAAPTLALARVESRVHALALATPTAALALRPVQAARYDMALATPTPQLSLAMLRQRLRHGFLMGPYAAMARHSLAAAGYVVLDGVPAALGAGVATLDGAGFMHAELHTAASDYGDPYTKSAQVLWLDGDLGADAALTCRIDDSQTYHYAIPAYASQHTQRVGLGRGARGRRWQFVVTGQGGQLRLRALEPMFGASTTRRSK